MSFEGYIDYEINLEEISSSINTRISGDTLFGKFCWVYREFYGEYKLIELLEEHKFSPILIFSGIFPKDYVPMPVYIPALSEFSAVKDIDYDLFKAIKKERYLRFKDLEAIFNARVDLEEMQKNIIRPKEIHRIQVSISRNTGTALEEFIFTTTETIFGTDLWVFLRVRKDFLNEKQLNQLLKTMFETGVGAKKSSGKGMYRIKEFCETTKLVPKEKKNAFVSLNRWIPRKDDPTKGYYRIYSKRSKIGGIYSDVGIFQKLPLLMIEEGSWFFTDKIKPYFGRIIEKVDLPIYELKENIIQSCYCLPIYFWIPNEVDFDVEL
ncbi:MAG: hypothetical protein N3A69_07725 [Leptospiraceae bacterium]|nr:hypothetical protein [Leptospiraceae bacterium]